MLDTAHLLPRLTGVGVVVIGRNEGDRLRECLESARARAACLVYVDSGSTDGSVALAKSMGVEVVELDMRTPFTAARARNEGFERLRRIAPDSTYVQFVDGDSKLAENWLDAATRFLNSHPRVAAVCGRLRERYPERSVYNLLCDMEWDTPVGQARACGGIAMMRIAAFESMRGFRADIIAGEEPELCIRLRAAGWHIWRLDAEMALHDAAIMHFSQWWRRSLRFGHALGEGVQLHGKPPERHWVRESYSAYLWGLGIPVATLILALWFGAIGLLALLVYPVQYIRIALNGKRPPRENRLYAFFIIIGKFPEAFGQLRFHARRCFGGKSRLIEYK